MADQLPPGLGISLEEWRNTPPSVIRLIMQLVAKVEALEAEVDQLKARLDQNSSNSSKPPSSDQPGDKAKRPKKEGRKKKRSRPGHRQKLLEATEVREIKPTRCACGCADFASLSPYYTHQHIELPQIAMLITHFVLYRGRCQSCGKTGKGYLPHDHQTGFGPRLSALITEIAGIDGNSRETIQTFLASVLGVPISQGAIQKVIDRGAQAIEPHYQAIMDTARATPINHLDETPWYNRSRLNWLWVMANKRVSLFMLHDHRSKEAFEQLIGAWAGILVSDNYGVYKNWNNQRQSCLAHLIRRAKGLAERADPELYRLGTWARKELKRLCSWAKDPPTKGQLQAFYARICRMIALYRDSKSEAGKFARSIEGHFDSLFTFLWEEGVEPTNNHAERTIRYAVLWRKRSLGTQSDKGCRWVERILSLRQTCRLQNRSTFATLTEAFASYFKEQPPDLEWIRLPAQA